MKVPPRSYGSAKFRARRSFVARRVILPAQALIFSAGLGSVVLLVAALTAVLWANSPWRASYEALWSLRLAIEVGPVRIDEDLRHWVNDGLMAVFFFVVGLEIKRELLDGELADRRRAALPVVAALGGMAVPALIYLLFNPSAPAARGWGIPTATDIAFSVGVLVLLGDRVPAPTRVFLLALAIVDDLGAILLIALFYSHGISLWPLLIATLLFGVIFGLRWAGVGAPHIYLPLSALFWVAVFESGIHATIAGVALGALMPSRPWFSLYAFPARAQTILRRFRRALELGDFDRAEALMGQMEELSLGTEPPLDRRLRLTLPWSNYVVLPLFALANCGVAISGTDFQRVATSGVTWGIFFGLACGKPLGILGASWLAVRFRIASLPSGVVWTHLAGCGILAGIGFTVSLFVTGLAFDHAQPIAEAKIAIFVASMLAGLAGYLMLRFVPARFVAVENKTDKPAV